MGRIVILLFQFVHAGIHKYNTVGSTNYKTFVFDWFNDNDIW